MGDVTIAQDLIDGVTDVLAEFGTTRTVRVFTSGAVSPTDPGAGGVRTPANHDVEAFLYEYHDSYVDGTNILKGDRLAILDIGALDAADVTSIDAGALLIDNGKTYSVISAERIETAGITVTLILQIRGQSKDA